MQKLSINNFDYSVLDESTSNFLQVKENNMKKIVEDNAIKLGAELKEAQEKLSKKGYGCFEEWFLSLGFKKTSVYDYIKKYLFVRQLNEPSDIERFQTLPIKVQNEVSKKSAKPEIVNAVMSGEVSTNKELEELKRQLKQKEDELNQAKKSEQIAISRLENLEEREPEVIEKEVVKEVIKEVIPEELQTQLEHYKNKFNQESKSANELRNELVKFKESFSDPEQASDEREMKRLERDSSINAYKISISIQNFIKENAVETYRLDSIIKANPESKIRLQENVELLEEFTANLKAMLNGRIIIK